MHELLRGQGISYVQPLKDNSSEIENELKSLGGKYTVLERKYDKIQMQLKEEKKRKNQLEIQVY